MNKSEIRNQINRSFDEILNFLDIHGDDIILENVLKDLRYKINARISLHSTKLSQIYAWYEEFDSILKDHDYLYAFEKEVADDMKKLAQEMQLK